MKLLLDEMYPQTIAEQLRARGHTAASVHDPDHRWLEGAHDEEIWAVAIAHGCALVTENVQDYRRIEVDELASGQPTACLIFTTDRQFPRGDPRTLGRLVSALDLLLAASPDPGTATFLKSTTSREPRDETA